MSKWAKRLRANSLQDTPPDPGSDVTPLMRQFTRLESVRITEKIDSVFVNDNAMSIRKLSQLAKANSIAQNVFRVSSNNTLCEMTTGNGTEVMDELTISPPSTTGTTVSASPAAVSRNISASTSVLGLSSSDESTTNSPADAIVPSPVNRLSQLAKSLSVINSSIDSRSVSRPIYTPATTHASYFNAFATPVCVSHTAAVAKTSSSSLPRPKSVSPAPLVPGLDRQSYVTEWNQLVDYLHQLVDRLEQKKRTLSAAADPNIAEVMSLQQQIDMHLQTIDATRGAIESFEKSLSVK
jgi:hypothetical protein